MAEYITKEQVRDIMATHYPYATLREETAMHHINEDLKALPAADVVEKRVGTWTEKYVDDRTTELNPFMRRRFYCSACGDWNTHGKSRYCPKCGAKMDGGDHGALD